MKHYDVIFFDLDGTLVDSNSAHAEVWSRAASAFDFPHPPSFFLPLIGMGGDHVLPLIDPSLSAESEIGKAISHERKRIFMEDHAHQLEAFPHARELLEACKAAGLRCIVATSASSEEAKPLIETANIGDLIEDVACGSDADHAKPSPDIVEAALKKANVPPERALLIGDTPYDIEAAKRAGVATVALRCGGSDDERLKGALAIFDDPEDLRAHLTEVLQMSPQTV
jgi:HAD superfamily hydrolase (TIGR01509 family)